MKAPWSQRGGSKKERNENNFYLSYVIVCKIIWNEKEDFSFFYFISSFSFLCLAFRSSCSSSSFVPLPLCNVAPRSSRQLLLSPFASQDKLLEKYLFSSSIDTHAVHLFHLLLLLFYFINIFVDFSLFLLYFYEKHEMTQRHGIQVRFRKDASTRRSFFCCCCETQTKIIFKVPVNNQFMCLMFVEGLTNNNNNNINSFVPAARWRQRRRDAFESFHSSLVRLHEIIIKDNNKRKALISTRSLFPLFATFARQQNNSKLKIIDYSFRVQHFFFFFWDNTTRPMGLNDVEWDWI